MSFLVRVSLAVVFCLLAVPMRGQYVYVTNSADNTVSAFSIGTDGALIAIGTFATGRAPEGVAVDRTGHYVYVANESDDTVSGYSIGSGGALTPVTGSPFPTGGVAPLLFGVDPRGPYIYVSNDGQSSVAGFEIGSGGVLTAISGSPFATGPAPFGVAVGYGKHVYVANGGDDTLGRYSIGAGGVLSPAAGSPFTTGVSPRGVAVGHFNVYIANVGDGTISAYHITSDSQLTPVTGSPFSAGGSGSTPFLLAIDSKDRFLYVTSGTSVLAYAMGPQGVLTPIATYTTSSPVAGLALDPTDSYLYVVEQNSNNISGYSVGTDGSLTVLPSSPFPAGNSPFWIAITP